MQLINISLTNQSFIYYKCSPLYVQNLVISLVMTKKQLKEIEYTKEDFSKKILIKGAKTNNLHNIDVEIPKNQLVVVTGLSGSGKSSLIIDTLYAEGQRRYVESLSSYARQFLNRMKKPEVDYIKGLCPAIAIEQKVTSSNSRSTVGSMTEIYDFLRLLYAKIGRTYSPISGKEVKKHEIKDVVDAIHKQAEGTKIQVFIPLNKKYTERTFSFELNLLLQKGFTRIFDGKNITRIEDLLESGEKKLAYTLDHKSLQKYRILIDRFVVNQQDEENKKRIADSILTAFAESEGECYLDIENKKEQYFNNRFELDGIQFLENSSQLFNYNNPYGACPMCEGFGKIMGVDEFKVIPNRTKSVFDEAIVCWKGEKSKMWLERLLQNAHFFDFPVHKSINELTEEEYQLLWDGNEYFKGIQEYFDDLEKKTYKIQNRILLARYRGKTRCSECKGGRLRKEASYVKISDTSLPSLINLSIEDLLAFFNNLKISARDKTIAKRIILEISNRLQVMCDIGLSYLHLDRISSTLSGGESQRINLTRSLGSNLSNSLYILDEPSIGLHPKDTAKLVEVLKALRDLDNTVVVVEHEEELIQNADYIIDIGPEAGKDGGELVFNGSFKQLIKKSNQSLTAKYMNGSMKIAMPVQRRPIINKIHVNGARLHNLKNVSVSFPLNVLTVVTGVSGSGKSTLVNDVLYQALKKELDEAFNLPPGSLDGIAGDIKAIDIVEYVSQRPIGRSSRSNPITYVKAYDPIRKLYTDKQLSKIRGYKAKHFSFNVDGGRCDNCQGEGEIVVEMQFLADVRLLCEDCRGKRFKKEILEVLHNGKNIADVLDMTIDEALHFFEGQKEITRKIKPLYDVGLGYIKLGQSSSTLSGGEAQRVKLASYLGKESARDKILFIFDEPTTGLHFHDISKLLLALNALVETGHSVILIEHNLDVIKSSDWIIELGIGGGTFGGDIIFEGTPEEMIKSKKAPTAPFLKEKFN